MALGDRQPEAALARVRQQLALEPRSAPMHALLGRVHLARRETDRAEAAFLRALELEPRLIEGYVELGRGDADARGRDPPASVQWPTGSGPPPTTSRHVRRLE